MVETHKYQGAIAKGLTVRTNDPKHPNASLQLKADVRTWIDVLPRWSGNIVANVGEGGEQTLYLKRQEEPFEVTGVLTEGRWITAQVEKIGAEDPDVRRGDFRVVLRSDPEAPLGPQKATVSISTTLKKQPHLEIPVQANVQGPINFYPSSVVMFADQSGRPPRLGGTIVLQARPGTAPFHVEEMTADDERLSVTTPSPADARVQRLGVSWTAPEAKGVYSGTIRIRTSNEEMPNIEVPFQVRID